MNSGKIDENYEWGYSHECNVTADGELCPIKTEFGPGSGWYPTREDAEKALQNDLRWRLPTFLIRRPRPAQPERVG